MMATPPLREIRSQDVLERRVLLALDRNTSPVRALRQLRDAAREDAAHEHYFKFLYRAVRLRAPNLILYAHFLEAAAPLRRSRPAEMMIERRLAETPEGICRWNSDIFLGQFAGARESMPFLARIKYGVDRLKPGQSLTALADRASERIRIDQKALDVLFAARRDTTSSRGDWEHRIRCAFLLDHIGQDQHFLGLDIETHLLAQTDMAAWNEVVNEVAALGPVVFVAAHAGLLSLSRTIYGLRDNWLTLQAASSGRTNTISAHGDPKTALFAAYREVQNGRSVLLAPDGPWGNRIEELDVLGTRSPAGEGAAFIAYQTDVPMLWINVVRRGDMLVPEIVQGPRRIDAETYDSFKARWKSFYVREVERLFTGDPDSLALRSRWTRVLAGKSEEGSAPSSKER